MTLLEAFYLSYKSGGRFRIKEDRLNPDAPKEPGIWYRATSKPYTWVIDDTGTMVDEEWLHTSEILGDWEYEAPAATPLFKQPVKKLIL